MFEHEVIEHATPGELGRYLALRQIEAREATARERQAVIKAKTQR